ncbi:MAG TPA: polysaccharide biosynthesis tyrosine autokinase [Candidatus Acidoferrum sp.]|nr:polysaccharide biosynthesis tyrosine autokinase [Candidatus Acidoferrum sp.]
MTNLHSNPSEHPLARAPKEQGENGDALHHEFRSLDYRHAEFSWEQAVRILRKNRRMGSIIVFSLVAATVLATVVVPNVYEPTARIEIAPPASGVRTLSEVDSPAEVQDEDYLATQTQILQSDALAVSVIRSLQLDRKPEFGDGKWSAAETKRSAEAKDMEADSDSVLREQIALATLTPSESVALDKFRDDLTVNPIKNTRLVEVSFSSHDPETAQAVTNEIVAKFIQNDYQQRYNATTRASEWLSSQLDGLYRKVVASNQAVSDYQRKYGLVEMNAGDMPSSQLMGEVNHQLSDAEASRIEAEAYLRMIDAGQAEHVPMLRDDKVYQDLLIRRGDLRTQLAQAQVVYGDDNTNVKKLQDQLAEIAKELSDEQARIAEGIRTTYSAAKEREELMQGSQEKLRAQMVDADSQMVQYQALKSEAVANAELYNTLQARLKEAGIYAGLGSSNIRVVDLAENLRHPTGPHRAALIAVGVFGSFVVGLLACFFKESLNNTVRTPEDLKSWIGLKALALLPAMNAEKVNASKELKGTPGRLVEASDRVASSPGCSIAFMKPMTAEAEAMRDLRTVLLSPRKNADVRVILISSSMEGEGKTTVAINFAIALAQVGRTCLVDADLRRPTLSKAFGMESKNGLSDVLAQSTTLANALCQVQDVPDLWVLPGGSPTENPADVLASGAMHDVCGALRQEFQYVVIDSAPTIRFSDARRLSRLSDEVVLVGRYGVTTRRAIQRSAELMQDVHAPLAGVVLNGIDYSSPDYHYFNYGYSRKAAKRDAAGPSSPESPFPPAPHGPRSAKSKGAHA